MNEAACSTMVGVDQDHNHAHDHSHSHDTTHGVEQSMEEMDFYRSIHGYAFKGDLEKVRRKKDDVNKFDTNHYTALHYAAAYGHNAVCAFLIEEGADIDAVTANGVRAIHRAALKRHVAIVEMLLGAGCDVETPDNDGRSPLHAACEGGNASCVNLFLAQTRVQATCSRKDRRNRTPLDVAREKNMAPSVLDALTKWTS